MRLAIMGLALATLSATASQGRDCGDGSGEPLSLVEWSATEQTTLLGAATEISLTVENRTGTNLRMVSASVFFDDVLGAHIGGWSLPSDEPLPSGKPATLKLSTFGASRLSQVSPADIEVTICTQSAVTAGGEKLEF